MAIPDYEAGENQVCLGMSEQYTVVIQMCVKSFVTPRTVAYQGPLFMRFPRQEYWSGLPFPYPRDLPNPGIKPASLACPALAGGVLYH